MIVLCALATASAATEQAALGRAVRVAGFFTSAAAAIAAAGR